MMELQRASSLYVYIYIQEYNRVDIFSDVTKHRLSFDLEMIKKKKNENSTWDQNVKIEKFPLYVIVATHTVPRYRVLVVL